MKNIHVVAAIIKSNNQILATQRGYGDFAGYWEFPGGKVELNETPEIALMREIKEEINVEITIEKFLTTINYSYPSFHLTMDCYICSLVSNHIELLEHQAARWLTLDTLNDVEWLPADIEVVEKLKKYLSR